MKPSAPGLLVSVRTAAEAAAALEGGADLIDVKEPARGSLGRAADAVVSEVCRFVAGRRPVSAALGELEDSAAAIPEVAGLAFVKWGLAGWARKDWRRALTKLIMGRTGRAPHVVIAAYADWECAQAPPVDDVADFACARQGSVLLLDTHCKLPGVLTRERTPTLLDWLPAPWITALCQRCHDAGVRIALAGSLGQAEIETLLGAGPDWFAVRGAACARGQRGAEIETDRVSRLAKMIHHIAPLSPERGEGQG